ncbi:MAG: Aminotransferase [Myxococcaceae bacterium]|nr:Aminotransferase [Myxococcaceae bacterium]
MVSAIDSFSARSRFGSERNRITCALERSSREERALLDLTESNPTHVGLAPTHAELLPLLARPELARYEPESLGLSSARRAVASELSSRGFVIDPDAVLLTASTSEAYGHLFKLLCDPGDSVLVPAPSYPLFDVLAQLERVRLIPYRLVYDGEWHLDAASLAGLVDARTRACIVVHPNNPTGSFLKRTELAQLAALGLPIISDEVFGDYALCADDTRAVSALEVAGRVLVFRLGGLSKACALPQLKLAWTVIAGPDALVDEARARLEHIGDAYLSPGAAVQLALPALLASAPLTQARIRERVKQNLTQLERALFESAASVLRVEGGWSAIVRLPAVLDDEAWALCLLEQDGVLTQPGFYYDLSHGTHVVVSLICEPHVLREGVERMAARVRSVVG